MSWLSYSDDEVRVFHPEFHEQADAALVQLGVEANYEWLHHPSSAGVAVVPDYVLVERSSGRWVLVVEIKRTPEAVNSERHQIQAKGYAESNDALYRLGYPRYFAVSNLEITLGFAARGGMPPKDCRVEGLSFESGIFKSTRETDHKRSFRSDLAALVEYSISNNLPVFNSLWPRLAKSVCDHAEALTFEPSMDSAAGMLPDCVRDYFSVDVQRVAKREVLFRCLLAEYVRGVLERYSHPRRRSVASIGRTLAGVANTLSVLKSIDFDGVFEDRAAQIYLDLDASPVNRASVEAYLSILEPENVSLMAAGRADAVAMPENILQEAIPETDRDSRGKAATDPELAALLAALVITNHDSIVVDPGCGEGNLLVSAYDRFRHLGLQHEQILDQIRGIEADSLASRIAALRLALKEPRLAAPSARVGVSVSDMFSSRPSIAQADAILMNPPFKRYEAQDAAPMPEELRAHFREAILALDGSIDVDGGQVNVFSMYVEYVVKASKSGAKLGIVLDNRWFHNETTRALRAFLLHSCEIIGIVSYPHSRFFEGIMIATSMLVLRKGSPSPTHKISFARVGDPGGVDLKHAASSLISDHAPIGWSIRRVDQADLTDDSWKHYFSASLANEFRRAPLCKLSDLFEVCRRGSLAKEGGGIAVYEFPERTRYGPKRLLKSGGRPYQTQSGRQLTASENQNLLTLAQSIPLEYRGYALNKADRLSGYTITESDALKDWTIEAPEQRSGALRTAYRSETRHPWNSDLEAVLAALRTQPETAAYIAEIETTVELSEAVLPANQLWNVLREPYAGELVIPRKQRVGHRVHCNSFAINEGARQLRLSSNFLSYGGCVAVDTSQGLDVSKSVKLIAAWLMSSFGHLQFELEANNREGARSIEQHHLERVWILDPRLVPVNERDSIVSAFDELPYPVRTDVRPELQPELVHLDDLFADEIVRLNPSVDKTLMLAEIYDRLHDLHMLRNN